MWTGEQIEASRFGALIVGSFDLRIRFASMLRDPCPGIRGIRECGEVSVLGVY